MKNQSTTRKTLFSLLALLALTSITANAQLLETAFKQGGKIQSGTFWSVQRPLYPPMPINPFPDRALLESKDGRLFYDDRDVDYAQLEAEAREYAEKMKAQEGSKEDNGPMNGGGGQLRESQSGSLYLRGPVALQGVLHFTIEGGEPDGIYDFYWHQSLGATSGWVHLARTAPGQTNLAVLPAASSANFFTLGTQQDSDGDTLPDAYEELVLRTDATRADTMATLAAAGADTNLLTDVPSTIRVSQVALSRKRIDTWSPCDPFPGTEYQINTLDWKVSRGGTNLSYLGWGGCPEGQAVTNFIAWLTIWDTNDVGTISSHNLDGDWSAPVPTSQQPPKSPLVKYFWHLEAFPGGPGFLRTLDSSGEFKRELLTGGPRLSAQVWPWIIHGSATELQYGFEPVQTTANTVPPTSISLLGTNLDATGTAIVLLLDNTTNNFTPIISGSITNYEYGGSAQKLKVNLNFTASGLVTEREHTNAQGQVIGYAPGKYDIATNYLLGPYLGTVPPPLPSGLFRNGMEVFANVPTNAIFDGGWDFHQDIFVTHYAWRPDNPSAIDANFPNVNRTFTPGTSGEGEGNDSGGDLEDITPDAQRLIINVDGPGFLPPQGSTTATTAPVGSIYAERFYARSWLTWNGHRVSDILRWRSFITLRRKADLSWERVGQNLIGLTPPGEAEIPVFLLNEAQSIP